MPESTDGLAEALAFRSEGPTPGSHLTRTGRLARQNLVRDWYLLDQMDLDLEKMRDQLPEDWHTVPHDLDLNESKVKVTLFLDRSVAKTFRALGKGHQG